MLARQPQHEIVPAIIGLGTPPFEWPDAGVGDSWIYRDANIELRFLPPQELLNRYGKFAVPRGVATVIELEIHGTAQVEVDDLFRDPLADLLAAGIGGIATTNHELSIDRPYGKLTEPEETMARCACAVWFADRYTPEADRLATMVAAAAAGDLAAIGVLVRWARHAAVAPTILEPVVAALHAAAVVPQAMIELFLDRDDALDDDLRGKLPPALLRLYEEHSATRSELAAAQLSSQPARIYEATQRFERARNALATGVVLARRATHQAFRPDA